MTTLYHRSWSARASISMLLLLLTAFACGTRSAAIAADAAKPNILFLAVDDLRPQIASYGRPKMITPAMDQLAAEGVRFARASCMVPTCGASRASLMSGIRPARDRFYSYLARVAEDAPGAVTLNTHLKENGYYTVSNGKIFHHPDDQVHGWSEPPWRPKAEGLKSGFYLPESKQIIANGPKGKRGPPYERADVPDNTYGGGLLAEKAISDLQRLKDKEEPFFLAVGFFKPHLPFVAPEKYWSLYDRADIHLPDNYHVPEGAPEEAIHNFGELRAYHGVPPKGPISDELALNMIHGYYACVSYTDAQIGKILDEVDRLDLRDDTIVILWSDHGWQLGEHTLWCKHCTFETSMHAPLFMRVPGTKGGTPADGLVEFIDIYPTLCELAGLPLLDQLDGKSFAPQIRNPKAPGKPFTIGRFGSGDTIRTDRYRYTEYTDNRAQLVSSMLYDHQKDSDENVNIVGRPENEAIVQRLSKLLQENMGQPF